MTNITVNVIEAEIIKKFADVLKNSYCEIQSSVSKSSHQWLSLRKQSLTTALWKTWTAS